MRSLPANGSGALALHWAQQPAVAILANMLGAQEPRTGVLSKAANARMTDAESSGAGAAQEGNVNAAYW